VSAAGVGGSRRLNPMPRQFSPKAKPFQTLEPLCLAMCVHRDRLFWGMVPGKAGVVLDGLMHVWILQTTLWATSTSPRREGIEAACSLCRKNMNILTVMQDLCSCYLLSNIHSVAYSQAMAGPIPQADSHLPAVHPCQWAPQPVPVPHGGVLVRLSAPGRDTWALGVLSRLDACLIELVPFAAVAC
jgi:hypothetical protein